MKRTLLLTLIAVGTLTLPEAALAQGYDDLDEEAAEEDAPKRSRRDREVREVTKGAYAKATVGGSNFLLKLRYPWTKTGTTTSLAVGMDFVDRETMSLGGELMFNQGIYNGMSWGATNPSQLDYGCQLAGGTAPCHEGDLRTYTIAGAFEASFYPVRRIGIGIRAGAGVLWSPLLIEETAYQTVVLRDWGLGEADPGFHNQPKFLVMGGPTFEYYSKLSHFSVGIDADIFFAFRFDLGINWTGYFKYTF